MEKVACKHEYGEWAACVPIRPYGQGDNDWYMPVRRPCKKCNGGEQLMASIEPALKKWLDLS